MTTRRTGDRCCVEHDDVLGLDVFQARPRGLLQLRMSIQLFFFLMMSVQPVGRDVTRHGQYVRGQPASGAAAGFDDLEAVEDTLLGATLQHLQAVRLGHPHLGAGLGASSPRAATTRVTRRADALQSCHVCSLAYWSLPQDPEVFLRILTRQASGRLTQHAEPGQRVDGVAGSSVGGPPASPGDDETGLLGEASLSIAKR